MRKESGENLNNENVEQAPLEVIKNFPETQQSQSRIEKSPEEKVDAALEKQDGQLTFREANRDKKSLSGLKKWLGVAVLAGSSLLAIGCNSEKPSSGFTDNPHEHVQRVLKQKKAEIEHMKKMQNYKPNAEAQKFAKEMQESRIVQPIDDGSGFLDQGSGTQRPGKNVEQGPTGRVMNPEDL